jgi:hypothetical protein
LVFMTVCEVSWSRVFCCQKPMFPMKFIGGLQAVTIPPGMRCNASVTLNRRDDFLWLYNRSMLIVCLSHLTISAFYILHLFCSITSVIILLCTLITYFMFVI